MIRINFDPNEIHNVGSLLFVLGDLKGASNLVIKLRDSVNPLAQYLRGQLTVGAQQQLDKYDGASAPSESLRDALIADLNQLLNGPAIKEVTLEKKTTLRETLIKELRKLKPEGESLVCLNRLLLDYAYPQELAKSQRAEWDGWTLLARAATKKVIGEWEDWKRKRAEWKKKQEESGKKVSPPKFEPSFQDNVWKGFRDWLLDNVFHDKCAYCETPHVGFPGDSEHFRPKGRVRVKSENDDLEIVTIVDENGEKIAHPGYFWLAYHWDNLLPACETCNRGGKNDLFPVKKPHVAVKRLTVGEIDELIHKMTESENEKDIFYLEPDDLDQMEGRLLLHPYHDDPRKHIYFKPDGTAAEWQGSEQGEASIRIYNLNDEKTVKARQREQANGQRDYADRVLKAMPDLEQARKSALGLKNEYYNGERPYAAAVFDFIHFFLDNSLVDPESLLKEQPPKEPERTSKP